ncbi:MAG: 16S rRNA (adenine(1518)-N(6)/adenine(1519)-N(6))-dimethyltransferase RsmA [Dehalococcoidia bacterium]|nr:16S rRNA (adenine(1518)-N(6)/adenine(1519)-N(6))-dimethyltransferase RsmA [Dehalococcoidia bacterium]
MTVRSSGTSLLSQTKALLHRFDLRARKSLGQHFLVDAGVLEKILETAELTPHDVVMEVGPGLGILTGELAQRAGWVIAIELDSKLAELLKHPLTSFTNVSIINEDVLKLEPSALIEQESAKFPPTVTSPLVYKLVANLPYYITSPVLRHFCEASLKPEVMVLMVQKEVAKTIVAKPGDMSILGISVQFYGKPEIVGYVPARSFYPAPKVDSAILKITLYSRPPVAVTGEKSFFGVVRAGFSAPRKQLINSLAQGLDLPKAETMSLLERAGIVAQRRAETLTLDEWAGLEREFSGRKN